jgi:hypothetical protein
LRVVGVDRLDEEAVVAFSDDTSAVYGAEQLRTLAPRTSAHDGIDSVDAKEEASQDSV